jgi:hypothetical protein
VTGSVGNKRSETTLKHLKNYMLCIKILNELCLNIWALRIMVLVQGRHIKRAYRGTPAGSFPRCCERHACPPTHPIWKNG